MVRDLWPGLADGAFAGRLEVVAGTSLAVFAGSDGTGGLQVFVTDGSAPNTRALGSVGSGPGVGAAELAEFTAIGSQVWFRANDGITGLEPWLLTVGGGAASVSTYGVGCRGSAVLEPAIGPVGLPRLGNAGFAVEVANGRPRAAAVLNLGLFPNNVPLGACRLLVGLPQIPFATVTTDGRGIARTALPIPQDGALHGLSLFGQYAILDPNGQLFGVAALSDGLQLTIGN
jgi:hypothetical protein